jgi:hypothetical protein
MEGMQDVEKCPVDLKLVSPADAKKAMERFLEPQAGD